MTQRILIAATVSAVLMFSPFGWAAEHPEHPEHPSAGGATRKEVTKKDISDGIKKHIDEETKAGKGKFRLRDGEKELLLTLVKVHDEKLASLGDGSYFACVDFKGDDRHTYDVDFFLKGEPGAMKVTETAVHKVDGKPRYNWKQESDGAWKKIPLGE